MLHTKTIWQFPSLNSFVVKSYIVDTRISYFNFYIHSNVSLGCSSSIYPNRGIFIEKPWPVKPGGIMIFLWKHIFCSIQNVIWLIPQQCYLVAIAKQLCLRNHTFASKPSAKFHQMINGWITTAIQTRLGLDPEYKTLLNQVMLFICKHRDVVHSRNVCWQMML